MKALLTIIFIALTTITTAQTETPFRKAEVDRIAGYDIFINCTPLDQYEEIGTVFSPRIVWSNEHNALTDAVIKQVKKEYPKADGIILSFENGKTTRGVAIKFKE